MTQNQIAYWQTVEAARANRARELLTAVQNSETARHNLTTEDQGWQDVESRRITADANWHNSVVNEYNAAINAYNASINKQNADTNRLNWEVNAQNAATNAYNADINAYRAGIDAYRADIASREVDLQEYNAWLRREELDWRKSSESAQLKLRGDEVRSKEKEVSLKERLLPFQMNDLASHAALTAAQAAKAEEDTKFVSKQVEWYDNNQRFTNFEQFGKGSQSLTSAIKNVGDILNVRVDGEKLIGLLSGLLTGGAA